MTLGYTGIDNVLAEIIARWSSVYYPNSHIQRGDHIKGLIENFPLLPAFCFCVTSVPRTSVWGGRRLTGELLVLTGDDTDETMEDTVIAAADTLQSYFDTYNLNHDQAAVPTGYGDMHGAFGVTDGITFGLINLYSGSYMGGVISFHIDFLDE